MGLNDTPKGERLHIAVFGRRNVGKSSLINSITGQDLSVVSEVLGTTTDPVYKAMELLPLGPVMWIDTPGLDDEGEVGALRIQKAKQVLNKTDIVLLVLDGCILNSSSNYDVSIELDVMHYIKEHKLPYVVVVNKKECIHDINKVERILREQLSCERIVFVSAREEDGIQFLKECISTIVPRDEEHVLIRDLLNPSDFVVLVIPIDESAPKGRLILPQQQTIRDILEANATSIVVRETEIGEILQHLGKMPKLVVTDSQVFGTVSKEVPKDIWLTSFSILMARYKGELNQLVEGVQAVERLQDGDIILISEGCTHHRQCNDIGTVKIPNWLKGYTGKNLNFETSSGVGFPEDLSSYKLIVHCGACMINQREMKYRMRQAKAMGVPMVNYGMLIAHIHGILERSLEPFVGK